MKKLIRDGKVAVLISPGFGAGWSTWNYQHPELLFDPSIVTMVEHMNSEDASHREDWIANITDYVDNTYGKDEVYVSTHGIEDLEVVWIPEGTQFRVHEYDGSESIEIKEEMPWVTA